MKSALTRTNPKKVLMLIDELTIPEPNTGCIFWLGPLAVTGYGQIRIDGRNDLAHRVNYQLSVGEVPYGMVLDHLCSVRSCVNPAHLEAVFLGENIRRGHQRRRQAKQLTLG